MIGSQCFLIASVPEESRLIIFRILQGQVWKLRVQDFPA
jgi:hypothetical protein